MPIEMYDKYQVMANPILGDLIPREPKKAPEEPEKREPWCQRTNLGCDFPDCPCGWP
jgi:hypothetical protein